MWDGLFMSACVREKARQALENDVEEVVCPRCGGWARLLERERKRHMVTIRGHVEYTRSVYQCSRRECRVERAPFDEELGLDEGALFAVGSEEGGLGGGDADEFRQGIGGHEPAGGNPGQQQAGSTDHGAGGGAGSGVTG